ncbi:bromodomain-containing protein 8-like isoform X2 [Liolophura sinensis]|uniref:bromodomain-containing protein 8-like isoform X2 n=1 Tax=Liolophura sinensis TaxID=3198878 RepID=UPI003157F41F
MATSKLKLKQGPLDVWSVRERLSLASSVLRNGDQNWVSVSRAIKPFGESDRPPDWFSQKNCASQYSELLEKVETPKRKRGDRGEIETPGNQIIRKLTIERIEELKKMVLEEQHKYKKLKKEVEMIKTGQWDDKLPEVWANMQAEKAAAAEVKKAATPKKSETVTSSSDASQGIRPKKLIISPPSVSEPDDSTLESVMDMSNDEDSNQTIPGTSAAEGNLSEQVDVTSPQVHPLTIPGALTKLQAIPVTPVPSFQATPGGGATTLTPPSLQQTSPQTNLAGRASRTTPPSSPLLSSLLKSKHHSAEMLQQMKTEVEQGQASQALAQTLVVSPPVAHQSTPVDLPASQNKDAKKLPSPFKMIVSQADGLSSSSGAPTLSKLLAVPVMAKSALTAHAGVTVTQSIKNMIVETDQTKQEAVPQAVAEVVLTTAPPSEQMKQSSELPAPSQTIPTTDSKTEIKQEVHVADVKLVDVDNEKLTPVQTSTKLEVNNEAGTEVESQPGESRSQIAEESESQSTLVPEDEVTIKEEPLSPSSSVSSRVSETGATKTTRRRRKGRRSKGGRRSTRLTRKEEEKKDKDDASSKPSDGETSDEERESDGSVMASKMTPINTTPSAFSESIPNSPLSQCSDTEDERAYKSWKKSIMLVWRAASTHKYASLFLHPVTNDIAPGYHSIVHRPMDLSVIKKNIETGMLRTTVEFQRDMMLMFTNAIMYNSSDHNVYRMAVEMYNDVLQHIEQYVSTQLMVQTNEAKILRASRRPDIAEKEEEAKKRRTSADQQDGGKSKKRKP